MQDLRNLQRMTPAFLKVQISYTVASLSLRNGASSLVSGASQLTEESEVQPVESKDRHLTLTSRSMMRLMKCLTRSQEAITHRYPSSQQTIRDIGLVQFAIRTDDIKK